MLLYLASKMAGDKSSCIIISSIKMLLTMTVLHLTARGDPLREFTGICPSLCPVTINALATVLKNHA